MNDIMFFLMLFFLIASTVVNPSIIKLLLPKSSTGMSVSKKTVAVSISKELEYFLDKKKVSLEEVSTGLQKMMGSVDELTVILYVDKDVSIENVVKVMDISNKLKVKLVLATDPKK